MPKQVLDVGNCGPDHAAISASLMKHYAVEVFQADEAASALAVLRREKIDLVLVNRKLDVDYSDGTEVIKQIKAIPELAKIPIMLVTNHDEYQQAAVALGASYGFGKLALNDPNTHERLAKFLS